MSESAVRGTSARLGKQPSFTCWRRQGSSSSTTLHVRPLGEVADRRVDEGEVAVLPDPEDGEGRGLPAAGARRSARTRPRGPSAWPSRPWNAATFTWAKSRSTRKRRKEAGWSGAMPTYSSRWNAVSLGQSIPGSCRSAARNSFCEGAEAKMTAARPSRARRSRMASATARAAARPIMGRLGKTSTRRRPQVRTRAPVRSVARRPRSSSAAQRRKCGQGHLRVLDLGVPALLPLEGDPAVGARPRQPVEDASGREVAAAGQDRGPGDLPVRRAPHVLEVDVAQEGAEGGGAGLGLLPELREGVGRVPHRAEPLAPRLLQEGAGRGGGREVAVRLEPDLDAGAAEAVAQVAEGLDDPAPRRGEIGARLHAVAEDADAARPQPGGEARRALRLLDGEAARGGVGAVEEGARVDAGDGEAGVGEAGERLPEAGARELGPGPERVVALDEAQLDAVVAEAGGGVEDAGERPGRAPERGEGEPDHVIRSSMRGVTRVFTRSPRKKRSRASSTMSAMARRTSTAAAPTWGVRMAPLIRRRGWRTGRGSCGSVTSRAHRSRPDRTSAVRALEVHDPAAGHVHDGGAVGQAAQGGAVEEAARRVGEAGGEDEELGLAQEAGEGRRRASLAHARRRPRRTGRGRAGAGPKGRRRRAVSWPIRPKPRRPTVRPRSVSGPAPSRCSRS